MYHSISSSRQSLFHDFLLSDVSTGSVRLPLNTLDRIEFFGGKEFVMSAHLESTQVVCDATALSKVDRVKFGRN